MATSRNLLAKLILDIQALGTIDRVSSQPYDPSKSPSTGAYVAPGAGGRSDDDAGVSSNATGHREQLFVVDFVLRSNTPNEDLLGILDAFTDQVEPKTSGKIYEVNDITTGGRVETVTVESWDPVRTSVDIQNQFSVLKVTVLVRYMYRRGGL